MDENEITRVVAIIDSMTPQRAHESHDHQRRAPPPDRQGQRNHGSGSERPLKQYAQARKMMKSFLGRLWARSLGKLKECSGNWLSCRAACSEACRQRFRSKENANDSTGAFWRQEEADVSAGGD